MKELKSWTPAHDCSPEDSPRPEGSPEDSPEGSPEGSSMVEMDFFFTAMLVLPQSHRIGLASV